jgi:hypothetical protein
MPGCGVFNVFFKTSEEVRSFRVKSASGEQTWKLGVGVSVIVAVGGGVEVGAGVSEGVSVEVGVGSGGKLLADEHPANRMIARKVNFQ